MRARPPRTFGLIFVIGCALAAAWCGGGTPTSPTTNPPVTTTPPVVTIPPPEEEVPVNQTPISTTPTSPPAGSTWVNVVGDTGWCGSPVMAALARLMENLGGDILFAGDLAYDRGTLEEFRRCFDPAYARFRTRSWAVPGNHEYMTSRRDRLLLVFRRPRRPRCQRLLRAAHRGLAGADAQLERADGPRLTPARVRAAADASGAAVHAGGVASPVRQLGTERPESRTSAISGSCSITTTPTWWCPRTITCTNGTPR